MDGPKKAIEKALHEFAKKLFKELGYESERTRHLRPNTPERFLSVFNLDNDPDFNPERALLEEWESVDLLFQLMEEHIRDNEQVEIEFGGGDIDNTRMESYLFFAIKLSGDQYSRTQLSQITREMNKPFDMPAMILFQHGGALTFAVIDRRLNKLDESKDVLLKATLIKDINFAAPHRAHIDILFDLSIGQLHEKYGFRNFEQLHEAWKKTLDTELLNRQFYQRLFNWFDWATSEAKFPENEKRTLKPEEHVIRLIARLLFVWFIKEKGLVADELFDETQVTPLLKDYDRDNGDSYYRAVLQNLFFATLNTEIEKRRFSKGTRNDHRNFSLYRYKGQMSHPDRLVALFGRTPFINGGLFDCLDNFKGANKGGYRIDCFSDEHYDKLSIPNKLFFHDERGLISLLKHYKFTVEENTPIEQEVALDPELLGKVFENLLAAYNPETGETVRKQTGSYYTPRAIVDYMVEEALVATLTQQVSRTNENTELWEEELRYLFDYAQVCDDASEWFNDDDTDRIVGAISELKILDPAVGSGAFPMSVLHKLTLALRRLDPDNRRWKQLQEKHAGQRASGVFRTQDDQTRREKLLEIDATFKRYRDSDFGRKLYLIKNGIFGVDIQPVACQIAKLRFFISLAIEQESTLEADNNFGIKPLPNLETRFVAANALIGLKLSETKLLLQEDTIQQLIREIEGIRERHFLTNNRRQKLNLEELEDEFRERLRQELENQAANWVEIQEREIERRVAKLPKPEQRAHLREVEEREYERRKKIFDSSLEDARKIAGWKPYDQNASADWFDPEWMFGIANGFDFVIGNPPYVQLQKNGGKLGRLYEPCNFDSFTKTGDIYCLFYEKANQLSRDGGHVCFITSNKWMRAGYGKKLRDYLIKHTRPIQLLDMGPDVFDATVDTNILLLRNSALDTRTAFRAVTMKSDFDRQTGNITQYLSENGMSMALPAKGEPWAILSPAEIILKRKIEVIGRPLQDWEVDIYRGIITGCNEAFVIDESKRNELMAQDAKSAEIIKPLLRGRDIQRYHVRQTRIYVLATGYNLDIPNKYPAIYNHLETVGEQIESRRTKAKGKGLFNRDDQGENWWNLRTCAYYSEFEKEKIVWKRIGSILRFAYSQHPMFCLDSTCIATGEKVKFLTAVLNSRLSHYQLFGLAPKTGTGDLIVSVQALEPLLVPPIKEANQHLVTQIEDRVDSILDAKRTNADADTTALEKEIDQIVYSLYDLTPEEIAIVEGNTV